MRSRTRLLGLASALITVTAPGDGLHLTRHHEGDRLVLILQEVNGPGLGVRARPLRAEARLSDRLGTHLAKDIDFHHSDPTHFVRRNDLGGYLLLGEDHLDLHLLARGCDGTWIPYPRNGRYTLAKAAATVAIG